MADKYAGMSNKEKVKARAQEFRDQAAKRQEFLKKQAAQKKSGDRQVTAASNFLKKASHVLAKRKEQSTNKPTSDEIKQKHQNEPKEKVPFSVRHAKKIKAAKTVGRLLLDPKREIRHQKSKLYKKLKEEKMPGKTLYEISKKKKWMYAMDAHLEVDKLNNKSNLSKDEKRKMNNRVKGLSKVAHDLTDVPKPKQLPKEEVTMDPEAIMNKFSPEELENMSPEQLRAAMIGEPPKEEPEKAKSPEEEHAEKMPDNGPTPEGETAETVAQRYAKALSGLNRKSVYNTFSGVKGGY